METSQRVRGGDVHSVWFGLMTKRRSPPWSKSAPQRGSELGCLICSSFCHCKLIVVGQCTDMYIYTLIVWSNIYIYTLFIINMYKVHFYETFWKFSDETL